MGEEEKCRFDKAVNEILLPVIEEYRDDIEKNLRRQPNSQIKFRRGINEN